FTHDSGSNDESRIIIFASTKQLQLLQDHWNWYGDGTFKVSPYLSGQVRKPLLQVLFKSKPLFQYNLTMFMLFLLQLYTIHGSIQGKVLPAVERKLANVY